ncbi:hypothetical protein I552_2472 [Mycobacterium xenopi 3993]|nr:hypothetical protein I552_2472 [Mycobacterium xenopi 3993]
MRGHPGHGHRSLGGAYRRRKGGHVRLVLVHHSIHANSQAAHPHWLISVAIDHVFSG